MIIQPLFSHKLDSLAAKPRQNYLFSEECIIQGWSVMNHNNNLKNKKKTIIINNIRNAKRLLLVLSNRPVSLPIHAGKASSIHILPRMWDWNLIYLSFSSLKLSEVCILMVLQIICHDSLILAFSIHVSVMNLSHFHFIFNQRQPQRKDLIRKANSKGSNMLFRDSNISMCQTIGQ